MDNFPNNKDTDQATGTEQVRPSTELSGPMQENVVRVYDKTTLDAAYYDDKIKTPKTAAELSPDKKSKKGLFIKLGATAAGLFVAVSAVFVGVSSANNEAPKSEPVAEAPADPFEPVTPVESEAPVEAPLGFEVVGLPTVAEIEISAEQTNEEIAQDLVSVFSDWKMSGANREMYDLQFEGDNAYLGLSEYVEKVTEVIDPVFEEALFGDNVTNPLFKEAIEFKRLQHKQLLSAHYQTYGNQNETQYISTQKFVSLENVIEREDGTVAMIIDTVREDNGDKNIVDGTGTGNHTQANYIFSKEGGVVKIVVAPYYLDQ